MARPVYAPPSARRRLGVWLGLAAILPLLALAGREAAAQQRTADILGAVVGVRTDVPSSARTAQALGVQREGSGVVIDEDGLVLTIGYLVVEAGIAEIVLAGDELVPADIVAYDHETGFGLLRASQSLDIRPLALGVSGDLRERDRVLVVSHGDPPVAHRASVAARREFAGYWEYLLPDAIFTAPPHDAFGGAALIGREGQLLGIGSLVVGDSLGDGTVLPGNMFVPIDALKPILPELLENGRRAEPSRPWLGLSAQELRGVVVVTAVAKDGPAAEAGLRPGDRIVSVDGVQVAGLADLYRRVWTRGDAGVAVPLEVQRGREVSAVTITSADRYRWLRLEPTY